jgi:hypothetical protein
VSLVAQFRGSLTLLWRVLQPNIADILRESDGLRAMFGLPPVTAVDAGPNLRFLPLLSRDEV